MVDVKAAQSASFIAKLPQDMRAVLLYGTDDGLIAERAATLAKALAEDPRAPGEIIRLSEADLAEDADRLAVELRTVSMFSGRKIVRLSLDGRYQPEVLADLLAGPVAGFLILEAGNLKPDSKLRSLVAAAPNAAAIACYADDERSLAGLIDQVLGTAGMRITTDAREHLMGLLGADRVLSRNEVEKLVLYCSGAREITIEDVEAVVADAGELTIDRVIEAAASGDAAVALVELDRSLASGEATQTALLAVQRYLLRLHAVVAQMAGGKPFDAATRTLRPPLHFKQRDVLAAQARQWSPQGASAALSATQKAVETSRLTPALEREIAERLLMEIARLARSGRWARI